MRFIRLFICIFLTVFLGQSEVFSATNADIFVSLSPQDGLAPCGAVNTLDSVRVVAKKNLTNLQIDFSLPTGISYVPGTVSAGITEINITNLNAPIFGIPDMNTFDVNNFTFLRTASCEAVQHAAGGGLFKDAYSLSYLGGTNSPIVDNDPLVSPYTMNSATLFISSITTSNVNVGDQVINRSIIINKGGNGCLQNFTHFVVIDTQNISNYSLVYDLTTLIPSSINLDTLFYDIDLSIFPFLTVGNNDACFDNGESISLFENFDVIGCTAEALRHHSFWGCMPNEHCQDANSQAGNLNIGTGVPNITIAYSPGFDYGLDVCGVKTFQMVVTNTNTTAGATAMDMLINIGLGSNGQNTLTTHNYNPWRAYAGEPGNNGSDVRTISNFKIAGNATDTSHWASDLWGTDDKSVVLLKDLLIIDPDGPGGLDDLDNDGYFDDLGPGESFTFSYDIEITGDRTGCGTTRLDYLVWEHCFVGLSFLDQCNNQKPGKGIDNSYENIIRDYNVPSTFVAPTDILANSNFQVEINPYLYGPILNKDPSLQFEVRLVLPLGISWTGVVPSNKPASFNQSIFMDGDTLIIRQDTNYFSNSPVHFPKSNFEFPLVIDCSVYAGGPLDLEYETRVSGCFNKSVHCGFLPTITPHCPTTCKGPVPIAFDAHRTTAGWTDNTLTTKVNLNSIPDIEKNNYLVRDTMLAEVTILINDTVLSNLWTDIYYTVPTGNTSIMIDYIDASYETSSGFSGNISIAPVLSGTSPDFNYKFDISESVPVGNLQINDTVWFSARFRMRDDIIENALQNFEQFRVRPFVLASDNVTEKACDTYGDNVSVLDQNPYISGYSTSVLSYCSPNILNASVPRVWNNVGDIHPSEYRPIYSLNSIIWHLPDDVIPTGTVTWGTPGYTWNETNGLDFFFDPLTNDVTITPNASYILSDQAAASYNRMQLGVIAKCGLSSSGSIPYSIDMDWDEYVYTEIPDNIIETDFFNTGLVLSYTGPQFIIQSPIPTVQGNQTLVTWDVEVANASAEIIPFNFVQIEEQLGITIVDIQDVSNLGASLNYNSLGGFTYAEIGSIAPGSGNSVTVRIFANHETCDDTYFNVAHGWACDSYPTDYSLINSTNCYVDSVTLGLEILISEINLTILNSTAFPVTMCTPFDLELELFSLGQGDIVNPFITMNAVTATNSLIVTNDSVSVEYPYGSGNFSNVSVSYVGPTYIINLTEHPEIDSVSGILGVGNDASINARKARILLNLQTECNFVANSSLKFNGYAENPCGSPSIGNGTQAVSQPISIAGVTIDYEVFNAISFSDSLVSCNTYDTIFLESAIFSGSGGVVDSFAQAKVVLNENINYTGIFGCTSSPSANCPVFSKDTVIAGRREVTFDIPQGIGNGTILRYYLVIESNYEGCEFNSAVDFSTFTRVGGIMCQGTACPFTLIETGSASSSWQLLKPNFTIGCLNTSEIVFNPVANEYHLSFSIDNTDTLFALNAGYTYNVYCSDASGMPTGPVIYSGTTTQALAPLNSYLVSDSFISASACDTANGLYIEFLPGLTNCQCDDVNTICKPKLLENILGVNDFDTTEVNTSIAIDVLKNDTSYTNTFDTAGITWTNGSNGLVSNNNGILTYIPNTNFIGLDSFEYIICAQEFISDCETVSVYIYIIPPIISAVDDSIRIDENENSTINVVNNDSAFLGIAFLSLDTVFGTDNGSLAINLNGTIDYTPNVGYYGIDSFEYVICDSALVANCDSALVYILINSIDSFDYTACDRLILYSDTFIVSQTSSDTFNTTNVWDSIVINNILINNSIDITNSNIIACDSVQVNNNWYFTSQTVRDTFMRVNGCDSIEITDVIINNSIAITNPSVIACDSSQVNGTWYTSSEIVRDTFTRINNCDSIEITDVTINNSVEIINPNVIACDSLEVNSNWYLTSQTVRDTFMTVSGCDSIELTDVTINNSIEITNPNVIACDSNQVNGNWYSTSQVVRDTFIRVNNCDSIQITDVTINNSVEITNPNVIACDSAEVNTNWYSTSQIVRDTFMTVSGCDSIELTDVTINNSIEITNPNIITCDSAEINNNWYVVSQIVRDTFMRLNGCDSIEITDVIINNSIEFINANIVACDSAQIDTNWYFVSQIVRDTFATVNGCDSIEITDLIINNSVEITNPNLLRCDSAEVNGNWYYVSQTVRDTFSSVNNCDSTEITDVIISSTFEIADPIITACDSVSFQSVWYFASQSVRDTIATTNGCDSVIVTPLVINNSIEINIPNVVACDSVQVNSNWYFTSQTVRDTFATVNSCDSIEVTDVTINNSIVVTNPNIIACDSAQVNSNWYLNSHIVRDTFMTVNGCDSIEITDVIINNSIETTNANVVACDSAQVNAIWYFVSQSVRDTLMTVSGCDSLVVTPIMINNSIEITNANVIACDSSQVNGTWYFVSQIVRDTFMTVSGCDSIELADVTINNSIVITNPNIIACDSAQVNTNWYFTTQIVRDTFSTLNGCDSIEVTDVIINNSIETTNANVVVCDSSQVNGTWYFASQSVRDTLMTVSGCDSVVVTPVIINNSIVITNLNVISCDSAEVNTNWFFTSQIVRDTFATVNGCDSIEVTDVTINNSIEITNPNVISCDSAQVNTNWYFTSQIVRDTFMTINGCDSIEITDVTINNSIQTTNANIVGCDSVQVNAIWYFTSQSLRDTLMTISGCDSVVVTPVIINNSIVITNLNVIACDSAEVNSNWYFVSQIVRDTFATINSCDSIEITDVTINNSIIINNPNVIACDSAEVNTNWYFTSQIVRDTFTTVNGCDSIEVKDVRINNSIVITNLNVIACDSAEVNSNWYFVSQIVRDTFATVNGCDSIELTDITINNSIVITNPNIMACDSSQVNGNWYFVSQIVRDTFTTVSGCDSIELTDVTINNSIETTNPNVIACDSAEINGNWYFSSQIVQDNFLTTSGCDSTEFTNLTVNYKAVIVSEPNDIIVCPDNSSFNLEFNFVAQNISTYQWQIDTGSGFQNLNDVFNFSGTQTADLIVSVPFDNIVDGAIFRLQYTDDCSSSAVSYEYQVQFNEPQDFEGINDLELCLHETNIVEVDYDGTSYVWNDDNNTAGRFIEPIESGEYIVSFVQNISSCLTSDTIRITIEECIDNCVVTFPTAFSPNTSSGFNDVFKVLTSCEEGFSSFSFSVFNRWGEEIYFTEDSEEGWDGFYKNAKQDIGVYSYSIEYVKQFSTKKEFLKGTFTLVR